MQQQFHLSQIKIIFLIVSCICFLSSGLSLASSSQCLSATALSPSYLGSSAVYTLCSPRLLAASRSAAFSFFFEGIEFYGSSQVNLFQLQKMLGIKSGASFDATVKAVEKFKQTLDLRHITANLQMVSVPPDKVFVVVDVLDGSVDPIPTRNLAFPQHVPVRSEKPFLLLKQLHARLEKLNQEGRSWSEYLKDGIKYYSDEPSNEIVREIRRFGPDMREELLSVVANDPAPARRQDAIELLNWSGSVPATSLDLLDAIDDSDQDVRANAARYFFPRLELLADEFPWQRLTEGLSRQLARPSHQDRTKALYCLLGLCKQKPELIDTIKSISENRVRQLNEATLLPTIKAPSDELLKIFSLPPLKKPDPIGF